MLDEDYTSSILIKSLAEALKEMQGQLLLTRDVAESLYAGGISTMRACLEEEPTWDVPRYTSLQLETLGRIAAYRGHRQNWTVWANAQSLTARFYPLVEGTNLQKGLFKIPLLRTVKFLVRGVPAQTASGQH